VRRRSLGPQDAADAATTALRLVYLLGPMKLVANAILSLGVLALLSVGIYLAATDRAAAPVLGFAFLFAVLLLLSKFKRFKGFGFEAEMWEEKQEEAAVLVDQLKGLAKVSSKQIASMAARLGLWDSALSLAQLADCLDDLQGQLAAIGIVDHEREEVLQSLYQRIEAAYRGVAYARVSAAFTQEREVSAKARDSDDLETRRSAAAMSPKLNEEGNALTALPTISIPALEQFVHRSEIIKQKQEILHTLTEIDRDIGHFQQHRSFRRREWLLTATQ
jgi:hypothetical protein